MPGSRNVPVASRKQPKQARSTELVSAVLEAAVQVLSEQGATRFTTARVAEKAGVSVGSLYQYFPNKAAILFRLQSEEWHRTTTLLRGILEDAAMSPPERLRRLVHAFVSSECDEAAMRGALDDAAPLYRDAPEARVAKAAGEGIMEAFLAEALPGVSEKRRKLAADLITATLSDVGKRFSEASRLPSEIATFTDAMSNMFQAYLDRLRSQDELEPQSAPAKLYAMPLESRQPEG